MLPRVVWFRRLVPSILHERGAIVRRRDLSTLNPARVIPADYVDLSGLITSHGVSFAKAGTAKARFPTQTHGFFYYVPGPAHAPVAGELRFRVTPDSNPANFADGHDLLLPDSPAPWRVPLVTIIESKHTYVRVFKRLREDGSISDDIVAHVRENMGSRGFIRRGTAILHSLSQPFFHDVSRARIELRVAAGSLISARVDITLPIEYPKTYAGGHVLCCFEAVNHKGRQALVLRVLDVFRLRKRGTDGNGGAPEPVAGELLKTAAGDVWMHFLHDANGGMPVLRSLLLDVPSTGYISRSTRPVTVGDSIRAIRNLAPAQLTDTDWMDLSLLESTNMRFVDQTAPTDSLPFNMRWDTQRSAFPQGTTGFFYVHVPETAHPVGAQLRFRLVSKPHPAAFAAGHDLRTPSGTVWYDWLPTLVRKVSGSAVASIVTRQGIIERGVIEKWQAAGGAVQISRLLSPLVCPGAAPFFLNAATCGPSITLGAGVCARVVRISQPFGNMRHGKWHAPFEGDALVQLVENRTQERFDMHVLDVTGLRVPPAYYGPVLIPRPNSVLPFKDGRKLWATMQEMLADQCSD